MKHALLCISWLLMFFSVANAQQRTISGKVTGSDGTPIPFATVQVKGTTQGASADQNGNFKLNVDGTNAILQVRSVGFISAEFPVGTSNTLALTLQPDKTNLQEVIVTGLGIKREKKALGYSAQDLKADELTKANQGDALRAMSGKIAGVQVTASSGTPGAATYIKLRGTNSLTGNNQPLFVVDGIPIDNGQNFSGDPSDGTNALLFGATNTNRGADINPDDIESMTVLKGPAAAAIYGIDAANGAIIITTKKGKAGKMAVDFSTSLSVDVVNRYPKLQNQYVRGDENTGDPADLIANSDNHTRYSWGANKDTLFWTGVPNDYDVHGDIVGKSDPRAKIPFKAYDNLKNFFRPGITLNNSVSFSGGTDQATYRLGVSNLHSSSIVPLQTYDRTTISMAGTLKVSEKLKMSANMNYTNDGGNMPQNGSNTSGIMLPLTRTPISFDNANGTKKGDDPKAFLNPDGTQRNYRNAVSYDNPFWTINRNPYTSSVNRILGNVQADLDIYKGLSATYRIGTDVYGENHHQYYDLQSGAYPTGRVFDDQFNFRSVNSDLILSYTKRFTDKFRLDAKLGNNYFSRKITEMYVQGDGLVAQNFDNMNNASVVKAQTSVVPYRRVSGYFDVNLDYASMLFLEITGRNDWSSSLPSSKNHFFYPAANLSWVFTELPSLKGNSVLSFGKVRVSAAQVGKDPGAFLTKSFYLPSLVSDGSTSGISFPYAGLGSFQVNTTLGNADLKPEKTVSYEGGLQLQFFNNRLGIDATYYYSKGTDLLVTAPIAATTGYQQVTLNAGSIRNQGVEIQLTGSPIRTSNFNWDVTVNFSKNVNKVLALAPNVSQITLNGFTGAVIAHIPGHPAGVIYGQGWLRDDKGNMVISDQDSNPGEPVVGPDQKQIGNPNPKFLLGVGNTFSYKGFSLYALIDWKHKGDVWNGTRGSLMAIGTSAYTMDRHTSKVFKGVMGHLDANNNLVHNEGGAEKPGAGGANTTPFYIDENWYQGNGGGFGAQIESFTDDGSYVKLREVTLAYDIHSKAFTDSRFIKGLNVSLFARNIILWTPYKGIDPETSLTGATSAQGIDYFNVPGTESFGAALKFKF
ncbi:SusC/RagA family TonB-linked outer membrane protein [Chitinophaga parva]|uniref:SusC/RagA family TonB-linked outer membrane protein n=1 Tax=Chitinophaga parva TaxID=2169414 RepID=A0A2T7BNS0_9BACT|nr:SusC/RagA family TonB-linked outer membrane protein [Chitinophaga parva]PUZ29312.1 SusC/RagA family TonB-linked outer membrane protein [Chitinophaga parva]